MKAKEIIYEDSAEAEKRMFRMMATGSYVAPTASNPLDEHFTREERLRMAYIPVVVAESIWEYIGKVLDYCAANRIREVRDLSRKVKDLRGSYYAYLRGSIDSDHLNKARECAENFQATFVGDMAIMWFTINNELKKNYPNIAYDEMRTDALCAILLVRLLKSFSRDTDAEIQKRLGTEIASTLNPKLRYLDEIMDAYVGDYEINRTELIQRCEIILRRAMETIKYQE